MYRLCSSQTSLLLSSTGGSSSSPPRGGKLIADRRLLKALEMRATITPIPHTPSWHDAEFNFNFGCWQIKILCYLKINKCCARITRCCKVDIWNPWLARNFYVTFCSRTDCVAYWNLANNVGQPVPPWELHNCTSEGVGLYHPENSTTVLQSVLASTTLRTPQLYFSAGQPVPPWGPSSCTSVLVSQNFTAPSSI